MFVYCWGGGFVWKAKRLREVFDNDSDDQWKGSWQWASDRPAINGRLKSISLGIKGIGGRQNLVAIHYYQGVLEFGPLSRQKRKSRGRLTDRRMIVVFTPCRLKLPTPALASSRDRNQRGEMVVFTTCRRHDSWRGIQTSAVLTLQANHVRTVRLGFVTVLGRSLGGPSGQIESKEFEKILVPWLNPWRAVQDCMCWSPILNSK